MPCLENEFILVFFLSLFCVLLAYTGQFAIADGCNVVIRIVMRKRRKKLSEL
jgi:hypothetical protein